MILKIFKYILSATLGGIVIGSLDPDGMIGYLGKVLFEDQTIQAQQYSESQFLNIIVGVDKSSVLSKIGQPLVWSEEYDGFLIGSWTKSCCGGNYRIRTLRFKDEKVSDIYTEYDWD